MGPIEYDPYVDQEDSGHVEACDKVAEDLSEMNPLFAHWLSENLNAVHSLWETAFDAGMKHKTFLIEEAKAGTEPF